MLSETPIEQLSKVRKPPYFKSLLLISTTTPSPPSFHSNSRNFNLKNNFYANKCCKNTKTQENQIENKEKLFKMCIIFHFNIGNFPKKQFVAQ